VSIFLKLLMQIDILVAVRNDRPVDLVLIFRSQITSDSAFGETVMDGLRLY
jgi:hypothetical protein